MYECKHYEDINFHKMNYDPKGYRRSNIALLVKFFLAQIFIQKKVQ